MKLIFPGYWFDSPIRTQTRLLLVPITVKRCALCHFLSPVRRAFLCALVLCGVGCTSARLHVCTSARLHVCTSARLHVCTSARLHVCTAARLHVCTAARLHGCTSARLHVCTAARLHPHTLTPSHLKVPAIAAPIALLSGDWRSPLPLGFGCQDLSRNLHERRPSQRLTPSPRHPFNLQVPEKFYKILK